MNLFGWRVGFYLVRNPYNALEWRFVWELLILSSSFFLRQESVGLSSPCLRGRAEFLYVGRNELGGADYADDSALVPKNTSVIIKRVPATRAKPILRVDDQ